MDDWRESIKQVQRYALLIGMLASVGLVIAVINILNLMLARVLKRTKAVGLSMALGSSRGQVFRQFMLEAVVLGLAGSVLGIALSFAFAELLKKSLGGWSGDGVPFRVRHRPGLVGQPLLRSIPGLPGLPHQSRGCPADRLRGRWWKP